jgi:hypothetical protein
VLTNEKSHGKENSYDEQTNVEPEM